MNGGVSRDNIIFRSEKNTDGSRYNRKNINSGILHIGVGNFHRAHQAVYLDKYIDVTSENWAIDGFNILKSDKKFVDALNSQDCLYSLLERSAFKDDFKIIKSIKSVSYAPSNPDLLIDKISQESIKILSLTITEKGYCCGSDASLDWKNQLIVQDLDPKNPPVTVYGYVVRGLLKRMSLNDQQKITVLSCDNLPGNGDLLRKLLIEFLEVYQKNSVAWVEENVTFPNSMVDRITPATTPDMVDYIQKTYRVSDSCPVFCEEYLQWVLEDNFAASRPNLDAVGVQFVADVHPYEMIKIRLLNGSHSAFCYLAYLLGYSGVSSSMADPVIAKFVKNYMDIDITPTLPIIPGVDLTDYKSKLIERFSNPSVSDQILRLASDGSQKIRNAIVPCIEYQYRVGGSVKYLALAIAGWYQYLVQSNQQKNTEAISDPMAKTISDVVISSPLDCNNILNIEKIFRNGFPKSQFARLVNGFIDSFNRVGVRETLNMALDN